MDKSIAERFWAKVMRAAPDECWEWAGSITTRGYGQLGIAPTRGVWRPAYAHRLSLILSGVDVPSRAYVLHTCDNRRCVNPAHLFVGTQRDNLRDMARKGRSTRGERNAAARLRDADVRAIRALRHLPHQQIAAQFRVSRRTIDRVLKGQIWSHVT